MCRPENTYDSLMSEYPEAVRDNGKEINFQIELNLKYAGYIKGRQQKYLNWRVSKISEYPRVSHYSTIQGLRIEARQKLNKANPKNLGQASQISGVSPADISVLMISPNAHQKKKKKKGFKWPPFIFYTCA